VASYETEPSHWSEDLTALHETESGRDHPIDRASRRLAVRTMHRLAGMKAPIILDVGCSTGFILEDLREGLPQAELVGADYLLGALESLARRIPDIPILQFDLRRCPLPDACVDGITCLNVLEHIDDHESALGHIHRILKPGGWAHIEVPAGPELFDIYDEYLMHHRRYRMGELVGMARAKGFTVKKATHLGFMVYPAFRWVKRQNRRHMAAPPAEKMQLVARQIRSTRTQPLLAAMIRLETVLGRILSYPCGIRCIVVLRKT
jgi:ubiquinone/menaquinone biosynthesis C-methylase UbiE